MLKEDFLESYFQYQLEEAILKQALPADEERPFDHYYDARKIMKELRTDEVLDASNIDSACFKAVVTYYIGMNYYETEETGKAKQELTATLKAFSRLPFSRALPFMNYIQMTFNVLGIIEMNAAEDEAGFAYFLKAERLYEKIFEILKKT